MPGIFLIGEDNALEETSESGFDTEDRLQDLVATHPGLLAGEQYGTGEPRRWLLVRREMPVADAQGSDRWSADHLFLDQDGVPTIVEVKRAEDTRLRREVVGQLLDYAAHAAARWSVERIRGFIEIRLGDADEAVTARLAPPDGAQAFWAAVAANLAAGRVRLVLLADRIPAEVRRIVEFLDEQMREAEILAVEVRHFAGGTRRALAPLVVTRTQRGVDKKSGSTGGDVWTEERFLSVFAEPSVERAVAQRLLDWSKRRASRIWWGRGGRSGSFMPIFEGSEGKHLLFAVWTNDVVEIQFQHLKPPFDSAAERSALRDRLQAVPGVVIPDDRLRKRPSIPLRLLESSAAMAAFLAAFEPMLARIGMSEPGAP